jgi:exodeoxyribonuclease V gamma subunit
VLTVHRAERADDLVAALAGVLAVPGADPFTPEIVAVPSRGIERWLAQRLSNVLGAAGGRADGVCANVEFPFPGRLVGTALRAVSGVDPDLDPWAPARAAWPLLAVIDEHLDDVWMATLSEHLGGAAAAPDDPRRDRRFGAARRLADLFDRYGFHRPAMVTAWAAGDDVDGCGQVLPTDLVWQPALWRLLRAHLGVASPAERLAPGCARLRDEPGLVDLPGRVSLYGLTRLAASDLEVLDAIATARDVHLFLLHPSPARWDAERATPGSAVRHPLLATWGKDARSMQVALAAHTRGFADEHHGAPDAATTLLHHLQGAIRADEPPPGRPGPGAPDGRLQLAAGDDSVQVHSCYGRARQVEVLRDAILHLLADDPTLEPRDVIVMCPDIETFAPLVHATFGSLDVGPDDAAAGPRQLQVRLADRALRQTNPVLAALTELLELVTTRITAPQLLDFAGLEPVRRRFRFDDDELARIADWIAAAGVRWGLDAEHRSPYRLERLATNTWCAGLDRLLLGVSMTEDDLPLVGGVLPLDDVDSGDIDLAGRLAELVDRVHAAVAALTRAQPLAAWVTAIAAAVDALTTTTARDSWQRRELDRLLATLVAEGETADTRGPATELTLTEARELLGDRLRGSPSRANFRTGHLTVCTLVPMRSVPHRVVCLLGLDDGSFPRHGGPDGDDVLERVPAPGDRSVRAEDRQLLLDAVLAAGDHLVVTYSGHDERTNAARPPSVPIGELLDVIDATAITANGGSARERVVVEHPLQPFDARNFEAGTLVTGRTWSFDASAADGARARRAERGADAPFLAAPLATLDTSLVDLDDLVRFVQHPTRAFLRQRLGIGLGGDDDELADAIPIELDGLQRWGIGDRLLAARLAGVDPDDAVAAEKARGLLPPLALGQDVVEDVWPLVDDIAAAVAATIGTTAPRTVDVRVDLGSIGVVAGSVAAVHASTLLAATFATVAPRHRLDAWVRVLALAAAHPTEEFDAVTIGRAGRRVGIARIPAITADAARLHLAGLVDLFRRGMREPLPIFGRTSELLARRPAAAPNEWETSDHTFAKEDRDPEHVLRFGRIVPFSEVLTERPRSDEEGPEWGAGESRVERYAQRLWRPLLEVEERTWTW